MVVKWKNIFLRNYNLFLSFFFLLISLLFYFNFGMSSFQILFFIIAFLFIFGEFIINIFNNSKNRIKAVLMMLFQNTTDFRKIKFLFLETFGIFMPFKV